MGFTDFLHNLTKTGVYDPSSGQTEYFNPAAAGIALAKLLGHSAEPEQAPLDSQLAPMVPTSSEAMPVPPEGGAAGPPSLSNVQGYGPDPNAPQEQTTFSAPQAPQAHLTHPSFGEATDVTNPNHKALTKGGALINILKGGLEGGLAGQAASAENYARTGRSGGVGVGLGAGFSAPYQMAEQKQAVERGAIQNQIGRAQVQMLPWQIMQQRAALGKTQAEIDKAQADIGKTQAETQAIPIKTQLEAAQAEAANYKEDPNLGLVDIRTKKPISDSATAPLDANEAAVLGKQPGEKVPLKLKNTASEIVNRGVHMVQANGRAIMADSRGNVIKDMGTANPIVLNQIQQGGFGGNNKVPDGVTGEAALAYLDPNTAAAVRMIGDGKGDFQTFASRMNPQAKGNLAGYVHAYNPDFNQQTYEVSKKVIENATSGSMSQQLTSIDRAREHMITFRRLATALNNGNTQLLNQVKQAWNQQFGSEAPTDFEIAKQAFSGEVGKAFAGSNVTEGDRTELQSKISRASSWNQLSGAADTADELLAGAQRAFERTIEKGMKGKANLGSGATKKGDPQAEAAEFLKKHSIQ